MFSLWEVVCKLKKFNSTINLLSEFLSLTVKLIVSTVCGKINVQLKQWIVCCEAKTSQEAWEQNRSEAQFWEGRAQIRWILSILLITRKMCLKFLKHIQICTILDGFLLLIAD